jgi:hypothetical protein
MLSLLSLKSCTRTSSGSPLSRHYLPAFLKFPTQLLRFGAEADHRVAPVDRPLRQWADVAELRAAVGMLAGLPGLHVRLTLTIPSRIVSTEISVARAVAAIPPRPAARSRRCRSFNSPASAGTSPDRTLIDHTRRFARMG